MQAPDARPIFSLQQARDLLPHVKHMTADAVRRAESLAAQLNGLQEEDPEHATLSAALRDVVSGWAEQVQSLGLEGQGTVARRFRQRRRLLLLVLPGRVRRSLRVTPHTPCQRLSAVYKV